MTDDLPPPDLEIGTRMVPYEERHFKTPGMAKRLGYTENIRVYYTADQLHALDAQWRAIVAAEVAKEREKCAALCDRFAARDMHPAECAAAIRAGSPGTAPPSEPV